MRFLKLTGIAALALVAACQPDDGGVTVANTPPLAFVRYINAVPDSMVPAIVSIRVNPITTLPETTFTSPSHTSTVRFVDFLEYTPQSWTNVAFRQIGLGGYQGVRAGSRRFKIFSHDPNFFGTNQRADTTFNFVAGTYYTIVHWNNGAAGQQVRILTETLPAANATNFQFKVMHLAQGVGAVDVWQTTAVAATLTGSPIATNAPELGMTPYVSLAPSTALAAQVTAPSSTANVAGTLAPAGGASASGLEFFAGSNQGGSVMTAVAFRGAPAVTAFNRTFRAATNPTIVWFMDRRPAVSP